MAVLLVAFGFLLLLGLGTAVVLVVRENGRDAARAGALLRVRYGLSEILSRVQDAETGQRGFLLTEDPAYLDPYLAAREALPRELDGLSGLLGRDQGLAMWLPELRAPVEAKMAELAETLALAQAGDRSGALAIVRSDRGKLIMDDFRQSVAKVDAEIAERLSAASEAQSSSGRLLVAATVGTVVLVALVCAASLLLLRAYLRALDAAMSETRAANESLERRVAERTADLSEANAELQRFAYIVSHDLRSPLVNVMGFTAELETALASLRTGGGNGAAQASPAALEAEIAESIGFIRAATTRMDRLIGAILRISREGGRRLNPEPLDMTALLDGLAASLAHQVAEAGTELRIDRALPSVVSDRLAVEQIFGNLLDNALKYLEPTRPGRIGVRGRAKAGNATFEVSDNGRGIDPGDRERVFDLFRRAGRQDRPGEGIGLAHVRALVRRLGGSIVCGPADGAGTVFRVTLPLAPAAN